MDDLKATIRRIQNGEEALREQFLRSHMEFIRQCASSVCKRPLDWYNDDELSISFIAFNKALDSFDIASNKSFAAFAKMLIKHSLVDYFRSSSRNGLHQTTLYEDNELFVEKESAAAKAVSYSTYAVEKEDLGYEVEYFKEILESFGLNFEDLTSNSPRHKKTRENLKGIARQTSSQQELVNSIYEKKRLPLQQIQMLTGARKKTLEKWRRYLLSLIIISTSAGLENIAEYIWGKEAKE